MEMINITKEIKQRVDDENPWQLALDKLDFSCSGVLVIEPALDSMIRK